jgi:hypothetical protein
MKWKEITNKFFPIPRPSHTAQFKDITREILGSLSTTIIAQQPPPPFGIPNLTLLPPLLDLTSIATVSTHSIRRASIPIPGDDSTQPGSRISVHLPKTLLGVTRNAWTRCFRKMRGNINGEDFFPCYE